MLIEAVEFYIYQMQQDNANQAAIDVYTQLLQKLETSSIQFKPMQVYKINQVEFDFDEGMSEATQRQIVTDAKNYRYVVDDEEDLVDEVSDYIGWCVLSIDYELVNAI